MHACDRCGSARLWCFTPPTATEDPTRSEGVYLCSGCRALIVRTRPAGVRFGDPARLAARRHAVDAEPRPAPAAARHEGREREAPAERGDLVAVEH